MDEQGWAAPDSGPIDEPEASPHLPLAATAAATSRPTGTRPGAASDGAAPTTKVRLPVPLRPMTMPDLLDGSFAVIKARPRTVFTIAAAILIPFHLITAYTTHDVRSGVSLGRLFDGTSTTQSTTDVSGVSLVYVALAFSTLAAFLLGGALSALVSSWYAGGDLTARQALEAMAKRAPALVVAWIVLLPLKIISVIACVVPAVAIIPLFALAAPAITVEGLGPIAGATRSWRLVSRRFWPCVGTIVVASIGAYVLNLIFGVLPQLLVGLLPSPFDWLGNALVTAAVSMVVETALLSVAVLLYVDLRIRTEGLDLALAATDAFARDR